MLYFQYLCIVLPATEVGDYLASWMKDPEEKKQTVLVQWPLWRFLSIGALMLGLIITVLIGTQNGMINIEGLGPIYGPANGLLWTSGACAGICFVAWILLRWPACSTEFLIHDLFEHSMVWFWLGMLIEPFLNNA